MTTAHHMIFESHNRELITMPRSPKVKKSELQPYDRDDGSPPADGEKPSPEDATKAKVPRGGGPGKKWSPGDYAKVIKAVIKQSNVDWKQISHEEFGGTRTASQVRPTLGAPYVLR